MAALKSQFELELARSTINSVSLLKDMSVVAIIGEGMAFCPGVAAKFLQAMAQARVNVRAIAQVAYGLIHWKLKASYTRSVRSHALSACQRPRHRTGLVA